MQSRMSTNLRVNNFCLSSTLAGPDRDVADLQVDFGLLKNTKISPGF